MKLKKLGRYFVPQVKIADQTDTSTTFRVVGVPFGGPEWLGGVDLHGEFFDRAKTDLGKDKDGNVIVKTIYAYYDHALNDNIGGDRIGYANFYAETDEGQVWDIEVQRAYRYHDMLLQLAQKGLLGASSQPVQTAVEIDWETGLIKQWHPAEISLTPTPANPNATAILKTFGIDLSAKSEDDDPDPAGDPAPTGSADPTPAGDPAPEGEGDQDADEDADDESVDTLANEIEEAFGSNDDPAGSEEEPEVAVDVDEVAKAFMVLLQPKLDELQTKITAVETALEASADRDKALNNSVNGLKLGLKTFSVEVAKRLKIKVSEIVDESQESEVEREAAETVGRAKSAIPSHAPGSKPKGR